MKSLFIHYERGFTAEECDFITSHASTLPMERGTIRCADNRCHVVEEMRKSEIAWIGTGDPPMRSMFDRVVVFAIEANVRCFDFEMDNWPRLSFGNAQFSQYHATEGGMFKLHRDMPWVDAPNLATDRKISVCVQLSDQSEYEGGEFHLEDVDLAGRFKNKGDIIIFPSIMKHAVDTVTKGTRRSLQFWFTGPPLR